MVRNLFRFSNHILILKRSTMIEHCKEFDRLLCLHITAMYIVPLDFLSIPKVISNLCDSKRSLSIIILQISTSVLLKVNIVVYTQNALTFHTTTHSNASVMMASLVMERHVVFMEMSRVVQSAWGTRVSESRLGSRFDNVFNKYEIILPLS